MDKKSIKVIPMKKYQKPPILQKNKFYGFEITGCEPYQPNCMSMGEAGVPCASHDVQCPDSSAGWP